MEKPSHCRTEKIPCVPATVFSTADEDKIVNAFRSMEGVDDFSKVVSLDESKEKKYSFSIFERSKGHSKCSQ